MKLTTKQQAFADSLKAQHINILTGVAGAGKTVTTSAIAREHAALFASPTHQAANVLRETLKSHGLDAPVATVASLLGNRPDPEEGVEDAFDTKFKRLGEGTFKKMSTRGGLLVVDEVSMVGQFDLVQLINLAFDKQMIVIVTGDPEQLPPVKAENAWDWLDSMVENGVATLTHLDENLRAGDDSLNDVINYVREKGELPAKGNKRAVVYNDASKWMRKLIEATEAAGGDIEKLPLALAFRNATVDQVQEALRDSLGLPAEWYGKGELLRVNQPSQVLDWHEEYNKAKRHGMNQQAAYEHATRTVNENCLQTGDVVEVVEVISSDITYRNECLTETFQYSKVRVRVVRGILQGRELLVNLPRVGSRRNRNSDYNQFVNAAYRTVLAVVNDQADNALARKLATDCRCTVKDVPPGRAWAWFYKVRGAMLSASSATCMTVHKSQGTGRSKVFVCVSDLKGGPSELLYVGVSRARDELHLLVD